MERRAVTLVALAMLMVVHAELPQKCKLPPVRGHCRSSKTRYYFDSGSNVCKAFTYNGCHGNENNFVTMQDCIDNCEVFATGGKRVKRNPSPAVDVSGITPDKSPSSLGDAACPSWRMMDMVNKVRAIIGLRPLNTKACENRKREVCQQPADSGPCHARITKYYYNAATKNCETFTYGGCQGNDNIFVTKAECENSCRGVNLTSATKDICSLPAETGPCRASFRKYFFDKSAQICKMFVYGGCLGNENKFDTRQECQKQCGEAAQPTTVTDICSLPREVGPCYAYIPNFFYNSSSKKCETFIYGGCRGNDNRFQSLVECEKKCVKDSEVPTQDICRLPSEVGPCRASIKQFYHNSATGVCEEFVYGGCQGNANRFQTRDECENRCNVTTKSLTNTCLLPPDTGFCRGFNLNYFFNATSGTCETFVYGGCDGNANRFETQVECLQRCQVNVPVTSASLPEICSLPAEPGRCKGNFEKYHFNATSKKCEVFVYGGCDGNNNKFDTLDDCRRTCNVGPESPKPTTSRDICFLKPEVGPCRVLFKKFYYKPSSGTCEEFDYGGCLGNENRFNTKKECVDSCSDKQEPPNTVDSTNVCSLPKDSGHCKAFMPRFFYNSTSNMCESFIYGGCGGNDNRFESEIECGIRCINSSSAQEKDACLLPSEIGPCQDNLTQFYYNSQTERCEQFVYGGCQGNENRFTTQKECEDKCREKPPQNNLQKSFCNLKPETGVCRAFFPSIFYNSTSKECEPFVYGGCGGNENRFNNKSECQRQCKDAPSPPPQDICRLPAESGPCFANFVMFYFDSASGSCKKFTYGGCQGNDNRFDSLQQCQDRCTKTGPSS